MNHQETITAGGRAVVINQQGKGHVWANLYVNAHNGLEAADITTTRWKGKTLEGARNWAYKQLQEANQ